MEKNINPETMNLEDIIFLLSEHHKFLSNYDKVPGSHASQWGQNMMLVELVTKRLSVLHSEQSEGEKKE